MSPTDLLMKEGWVGPGYARIIFPFLHKSLKEMRMIETEDDMHLGVIHLLRLTTHGLENPESELIEYYISPSPFIHGLVILYQERIFVCVSDTSELQMMNESPGVFLSVKRVNNKYLKSTINKWKEW